MRVMTKKTTLLTLLSLCSFLLTFAQQMPIDFQDSSQSFTTFNGSSFSTVANPEDNLDQVGEITNDGNNPWQGILLNLQRSIDLSENKQIVLDFYSLDANAHTLMIKLEDGTNSDVEVWIDVNAGFGNQWINDLTFDFSNALISGTGNTINASGTYNRIVVFVDGGANVSGTYLVDDIDDGSEPIDFHPLDVEYTELVWSDEFDEATLNTDKWHHEIKSPSGGMWNGLEEQNYTDSPSNSYVEDGYLHIVAKKETITQYGLTLEYSSARLNSKYAFTYGRVDIRAKLPEGEGTFPALWMLGDHRINTIDGVNWENQGYGSVGTIPWPDCGEIDIMEHGLRDLDEVTSALHSRSSYGNTVNVESKHLSDVSENFHIYSVNWSPNQITFLIDGEGYYTYRKPDTALDENNDGIDDAWPFDEDQYLLLNVAMGGFAGTVDPNFTESAMVIDYVRVFQTASLSTEDLFSSKFIVYPVPTKGILYIQTYQEIEKIQLLSNVGQLVKEQMNQKKSIDVKDLASGIYLLRIYANNKMTTKKVIIQK